VGGVRHDGASVRQQRSTNPHATFRLQGREGGGVSSAHRGFVVWFTGLSGAGKSTLAGALTPHLRAAGKKVELLDGDVVRTHLSGGLGFTREDRDTNIARIAFVAHLLARNGVVVLVSAISPFRQARDLARVVIGDFVEVHVAPPLAECIKRDVKGLYQKALAGQIKQFTGVSDPYEEPLAPELTLDTSAGSVEEDVARLLSKLRSLGYLGERSEGQARV
jgi:adenylylsulfate kinase